MTRRTEAVPDWPADPRWHSGTRWREAGTRLEGKLGSVGSQIVEVVRGGRVLPEEAAGGNAT